jgi:homoserine kinase
VSLSFATTPVRVRVPASSANLGPGFDALGLALGLYDEVTVRVGAGGLSVDAAGEGAADLDCDEGHLVVRAMRAAFDVLGAQPPGLELRCDNRIPHGRGLGSSAAAIVAGIVAARALVVDRALDDTAALRLATEMEGHPDNVAAALLGGLTVAWYDDGGPRAVRLPVHPSIAPLVFVPDEKSSTAHARTVLPDQVPHADAAANAGRAALLVEALGRRPELLLDATEDRLHQSYRAASLRRTTELVQRLRAQGHAAVVSGSGPTVLVLGPVEGHERAIALAGHRWAPRALAVDTAGARVG